ncbi:MAG: PA0069 family radical SAM protein [Fibrobacterota bacterium]|nr:PA0069 family radical SAM protein [Fibrobacterota bacterium]
MANGPRSYKVRQEANPENRFDSIKVEWDDGVELPQTLRIHNETAKSIVSENDSPDIPFRYSVNPYRGCAHACAYCYARPSHEYLGLGAGTDFDTQIYAKTNAAELLRKKLSSKSWVREPITFSGVTDCYQPAEAKLKLTRACLEVCLEYRQPVSIITKSSLILRDLDLLIELDSLAGVGAVLSIPFADEATARLMEPFAAPPDLRFRTLEKLSRAGIRTGISLGPVIPGLNDSDIPSLLARAKECGATFAFYVMLRLPGSVREVFLERVKTHLPEKAGKIEHHIREVRGGGLYKNGFGDRMTGTGTMADMVEKLFRIHSRKYGLDTGERMGELAVRGGGQPMGAEWVKGKGADGADPGVNAPIPKGKSLKCADSSQLDLFAT